MRRPRALAVVVAVAVALGAAWAQASPAAAATCPATRIQTADGCVSRAVARHRVAAIVESEVSKQGLKAAIVRVDTGTRPLLSRAYGQSMAGVPATTSMHFRIGSMAIPYLITVLLQLQDEGRLSLDDKLSKYRPQLPHANQITLRELAANTSGYLDWIQGNEAFATALFANVFKQWSVPELLSTAFDRGMACAPGTCFVYAHTNYAVLAQVISVVTGHSVRREIAERVLEPLGLRGIAISRLPAMPGPVLHSYNSLRGNYEDSTFWSPSWTIGAGTVMSGTIADVAKSARAIGTGATLSPAASRERFAADPAGLGHIAPGIHFGLGILVGNGWRVQNPNLNGYTGIEAYLPSRGISVAIVTTLSKRIGASETSYSTELFNRIARYLTPDHPGLAVGAVAATASSAIPTVPHQETTPVVGSVIASPEPVLTSNGRNELAYEIQLTNRLSSTVTVHKVEALAGGKVVEKLSGRSLEAVMQPFGESTTSVKLGPGQTGFVMMDVSLARTAKVPAELTHRIAISLRPKVPVPVATHYEFAPVKVTRRPAVVIQPPVYGPGWIIGNGCCANLNAHRSVVWPVNGKIDVAERFAIDFSQINAADRYLDGPADQLTSSPAYGAEVHAVAAGTVVGVRDDIPETPAGVAPHGLTLEEGGGDQIVLAIGHGRYAFYGHLQHGSITVRRGDRVKAGQTIARLGNSGNSIAVHLHFHLMNGPAWAASNGIPYRFTEFNLVGKAVGERPESELVIDPAGHGIRRDELPMDEQIVEIPPPS